MVWVLDGWACTGYDEPYAVRTTKRVGDDDDARCDASVGGCAGRCGVWGLGGGGRCGNYIVQEEYLRPALQCSLWYICTVCTTAH